MTSPDVRARLTQAVRLGLVGPDPDEPQIDKVPALAPSRWYLTGFLASSSAPVAQ
jgi:hypothetical protein